MKVHLKLMRIGMNMEEATITKWHKQPGEAFATGDVIYEIETEKVNQEVEAPADGTMVEIRIPEGEVAEVDQTVCVIDAEPVGSS